MIESNREISFLLKLVDDPDKEVFDIVADKLMHIGSKVVPDLEIIWECTYELDIQERIEQLIHQLHFKDIAQEFKQWNNSANQDIIEAAYILAKVQFPNICLQTIQDSLHKINTSIWLELNEFQTPLEKAHILHQMFYSHLQFKVHSTNYNKANEFFINKILENKDINAFSMAVIYQWVCEQLNINAKYINFPNKHLIAYYKSDFCFNQSYRDKTINDIHFLVDIENGSAYTIKDVKKQLNQAGLAFSIDYFRPLNHCQLVQKMIDEISKCFQSKNQSFKQNELLKLADLLLQEK